MCAGALWRIKGDKHFSLDLIGDMRFLRIFFIAVVLHMIWNSPLYLPFYLKYILLGVVAWIIIFALIQAGLRQILAEKTDYSAS